IVGGNAGTEQRRGFGGVERIWHLREGFDGSDHVLRVAAVKIETGDFLLRAVGKIAPAAVEASVVLSAVPADADALALLQEVTPGPSSAMTPATSWPGE